MSIDLTGINNVNDFFTSHYLATYFEDNVREASNVWKELEQSAAVKSPASALRTVANRYYKTLPDYEAAVDEETQMSLVVEVATSVLQALGYGDPAPVAIEIEEGLEVPVFHEVCASDGKPALWALLANNKDSENDVLMASAFDPVRLIPLQAELDNERLVSRLFFDTPEPPRFIMLLSMTDAVLLDRNKWGEKRCMIFDLETIFARKEDSTLRAVATLLCKLSICPSEGELLLDRMDKRSRDNAAEVSDRLKYSLRECIELLGNEVIYDWVNNKGKSLDENPLDAGELTIECLRYMYRMLFLLFMEARPELGFAPMKSDVYAKAYSLESLREIEESLRESLDTERESNYLDQTLDKLCHRVYYGYPEDEEQYRQIIEAESVHDIFVMPPLKAHIFDEERTPLIKNARLRDSVLLNVIDLMSISRAQGRRERAERISYGTLGINQLGAVYEALLSYRGFIAEDTLYEVREAGGSFDPLYDGYFVRESDLGHYNESERVRNEDGSLRTYAKGTFVYRPAGHEREKSASYYTPECLTQCLVRHALKELLEGKSADEILELTVCEPAMGSAAFLNETINQLAEAYLQKRQEELGEQITHDQRDLMLQQVKMFIADRNIYGIDLNPIAVELAEVSLWLNSISQDGFVPWFGNQLHNGNSLIGARRRGYTKRELMSRAAGIRWYDIEPERIGYETGCSKSHRVYHFLAFDPSMALYKDKAVKELEPDAMKTIADWNKALKRPYTDGEYESMRKLSMVIDELWEKQIKQQRSMRAETKDSLSVYGHGEDGSGPNTTIRQKDEIYSKYYLSEHERNAGPFARLKFAMDYWCALWFWPVEEAEELPTRAEFLMDMGIILEGNVPAAAGVKNTALAQTRIFWEDESLNTPEQMRLAELQKTYGLDYEVDLDKLCVQFRRFAIVREIAERQHFFHWELEFADVFEARGGFDLIIGNPPWVKLEWNEQTVLSDEDPRFAVKGLSAAQTKKSPWRAAVLEDTAARGVYLEEYVSVTATKAFLGAIQNYILLKGTSTNLYKCFIPQAISACKAGGVFSFVHPTGVFDEANAGVLRSVLYHHLRRYYRFENELKLFPAVGNAKKFALAVYGDAQAIDFDNINDLFDPVTIDECYDSAWANEPVPPIKDERGWCIKGHPKRLIHITEPELKAFAQAFSDGDDWEEVPLPVIHAEPMLQVIQSFAESDLRVRSLGDSAFATTLWAETGAQETGLIEVREHFPGSYEDCVVTGPNIGVSNPLFQSAKKRCDTHRAFDSVDLTQVDENYIPRVKYAPLVSAADQRKNSPMAFFGQNYLDQYRILARRRLNQSGSRTLIPALFPPNCTHVHTVLGIALKDSRNLLLLLGAMSSIPYDAFIKITGKADVYFDTVKEFPLVKEPYANEIVHRVLLLNCLNRHYASIWEECWESSFLQDSFSKIDQRLDNGYFKNSSCAWSPSGICRTDFQRRQLQVEIDVLVSMSLGLTLESLIELYHLQFPVVKSYEDDTWYDRNGNVAFSRQSLGAPKSSRQDFERSHAANQDIEVTYVDETLPSGPRERTVRYIAPYDCCDRVADYRQAWAFFAIKYGIGAPK